MNIKVYNQAGKKSEQFDYTGENTWKDVREFLEDHGVITDGFKAVIGETQLTLESALSETPDEDWTLFLLPNVKIKSGSDSDAYWENDNEGSGEEKEEVIQNLDDILKEMKDLVKEGIEALKQLSTETSALEAKAREIMDNF